ncbi:hypothetical protein RI367_001378 [Sorochytrium milnesiophthora]
MCKLCDCGKHRCGRPMLPAHHLDSDTEYYERFKKHPVIYTGQIKPKPQAVASEEPMSSSTENRDRFKEHSVSRRAVPPRKAYAPNPAHLESETGYKHDYQVWALNPPKPIKKDEEWKQTNNEFSSATTSKEDYQPWKVQPRWQRPKQAYQPNAAKLDPNSSYSVDFKPTPVSPRKQRAAEVFQSPPDDRSFDSTMRTAFVGFTGTRPQRRIATYVAPNTTFDGSTTTGSDFVQQKMERRQPCKPAAALPPNTKFDGATEYTSIYTGKTVPRYFRPPVEYRAPNTHFEGVSTMQTDFKGFGAVKRAPDFAPRVAYKNEHDDRTWSTETSDKHGKKVVALCAAVRRHNELEKQGEHPGAHSDGHVYLCQHKAAAV